MDTKVKMTSHAIMGGGPAANSTAAAAALGMNAAFVGTVGDDADGRMILADFAKQGGDTSMMKIRKGVLSPISGSRRRPATAHVRGRARDSTS